MKKIVFTGGGTAGHVIPNLAIIDELKNKAQIFYIGSNGIEKNIIKDNNIKFYEITSTKLRRTISLKNFLIPFKLLKAFKQSKKILKELKPDVVFSKGGYVALPVVLAAKKLKIPVICHESDYTMGLANKLCKNKCTYVCTSFENTSKSLKNGVFTGSPLRKELFLGKKENAKKLFKNYQEKPTILIVGGSLGSKIINENIIKILPKLSNFNIIHLVGKNNLTNTKFDNYVELEFSNNIADLFSLSDLVISRAGSNAIFEILALNKPNILIPLSKKASRGDQIINANYFKEKGYSKVILEEDLNETTLLKTIENLWKNKEKYIEKMKKSPTKNATNQICDLIMKTTTKAK
ncbi:MAG: undecaprenyldiphospho-muramoylpentapeptide beta-N-acetylglucosaminyltransferase [Clostridiales bacterium]|nr:undecaprenyldiphospho-muramoylpentapeptide beta-N-acetylglucosaminyltransferase [Clostridiales bacterium]